MTYDETIEQVPASPAPSPNHFLQVFYGILFHPVQEFERIRDEAAGEKNLLLLYGILFVLVMSGLSPLLRYMGGSSSAGDLLGLMFQVPLQAVAGLVMWGVMGSVISLLAYAFSGNSRFQNFLILSAFATVPWLLMVPLALIKQSLGLPGVFLGTTAGMVVWLWTVLLFALAVGVTYQLSLERVLIVLVMPFLMVGLSFLWLLGFFLNLFRLV
jgi:hypothetical protein